MKRAHTIFNAVGITVALIIGLCLSGLLMHGAPRDMLDRGPGFWTTAMVIEAIIIAVIGGGSLINLVGRRLVFGPTLAMIIVYCATFWLIPLGIWGAIALATDRKKQRTRRHTEVEFTHRNAPAKLPPPRSETS